MALQTWESRSFRAGRMSSRATNPECFHEDGTWKRGARVAVRSAGYQALRRELAETERVLQKRRAP